MKCTVSAPQSPPQLTQRGSRGHHALELCFDHGRRSLELGGSVVDEELHCNLVQHGEGCLILCSVLAVFWRSLDFVHRHCGVRVLLKEGKHKRITKGTEEKRDKLEYWWRKERKKLDKVMTVKGQSHAISSVRGGREEDLCVRTFLKSCSASSLTWFMTLCGQASSCRIRSTSLATSCEKTTKKKVYL